MQKAGHRERHGGSKRQATQSVEEDQHQQTSSTQAKYLYYLSVRCMSTKNYSRSDWSISKSRCTRMPDSVSIFQKLLSTDSLFSCEARDTRQSYQNNDKNKKVWRRHRSLGKFPNTIVFIVSVDAADVNSKFWKNIIIRSIDLSGRKNKRRWIS